MTRCSNLALVPEQPLGASFCADVLSARTIREPVPGSPYQPGDRVVVVRAVDREVCDVSGLVGQRGRVEYLEYDCGCGQSRPGDPMVGVMLEGGVCEEFWKEELRAEEDRT